MIKAVITAASVKQKRTRCGVPEKIRKSNAHATIEGIVEREREISTEKLESNYNREIDMFPSKPFAEDIAPLIYNERLRERRQYKVRNPLHPDLYSSLRSSVPIDLMWVRTIKSLVTYSQQNLYEQNNVFNETQPLQRTTPWGTRQKYSSHIKNT